MKSRIAPIALVLILAAGLSISLQADQSTPQIASPSAPDKGSTPSAPPVSRVPLELLLDPPSTPVGPCSVSLVCNCSGVTITCSASSGTCVGGDEGTCSGYVQCTGQPVIECPTEPAPSQCTKDSQCTEICGGFGLCRNNRCLC